MEIYEASVSIDGPGLCGVECQHSRDKTGLSPSYTPDVADSSLT